ncbi:SAM-dependent methyltransferase [Actinacidiphila bryophytorum]|uniref:SAM-dependent methyltransferase n=1 Tax=Actinacidiphila bryophytorum TaxID=1436133 RepID=UPI002176D5B4|nr:SAM-dependent methyltransferase [Actinacidiphila bryophytorum]UWE09238.1 SAM-dependent methyltransferase [Actinacidiphila bryophytorum]
MGEELPQAAGDRLRQDIPHSARMYDYYLGGNTNYAVDREAAERVIATFPAVRTAARVNRAFVHRSARTLARDHGIRQFLDIGTGIPTAPNLHEVVQREIPQARVTYVDNDPIVLVYADSLLRSSAEGATDYVEADVTDPEQLLDVVRRDGCLDLDLPVGLSLNALLHFVPDEQDAYGVVAALVAALAPGSYLTISHCTPDFAPEVWAAIVDVYTKGGTALQVRSRDEVREFFTGLDLLEPGVAVAHRWNPEPASGPSLISDADASLYAGVARKP